MNEIKEKLSERKINISLDGVDAKVIYHVYEGFKLNTLLVSFGEKRRVLSTIDGYKELSYVANNYTPFELSQRTMKNYQEFKQNLPLALGFDPTAIAFLSTGVNMDQLAICEKSYERSRGLLFCYCRGEGQRFADGCRCDKLRGAARIIREHCWNHQRDPFE